MHKHISDRYHAECDELDAEAKLAWRKQLETGVLPDEYKQQWTDGAAAASPNKKQKEKRASPNKKQKEKRRRIESDSDNDSDSESNLGHDDNDSKKNKNNDNADVSKNSKNTGSADSNESAANDARLRAEIEASDRKAIVPRLKGLTPTKLWRVFRPLNEPGKYKGRVIRPHSNGSKSLLRVRYDDNRRGYDLMYVHNMCVVYVCVCVCVCVGLLGYLEQVD